MSDFGSLLAEVFEYLAVILTIVFIHEFGHFIVGRWCGVKVETFSLGFGPELIGFNDRKGTHWRLAAIPLGGYVKFFGDANAASAQDESNLAALSPAERAVSLGGQSLWKRAAIVAAGPAFNFMLSILIFSSLLYINGRAEWLPRIAVVSPNTPAQQAGLQPGDLVVSIDGRKIKDFTEMLETVTISSGVPLNFVVDRAGAQVPLTVTPRSDEIETLAGKQRGGRIGVEISKDPADRRYTTYNLPQAFVGGVQETGSVIGNTVSGIKAIATGRLGRDQISGPGKLAKVTGNVAREFGIGGLIALVAMLSATVGFINLMPVPILDGGHLLFYGLEALKRAPLSQGFQQRGFMVGAAILACLIFFILFNEFTTWN